MSEPGAQSRPDDYVAKQAEPQPIYYPRTSRKLGAGQRVKVAINIVGKSGVGKSHCAVYQFAKDRDYGPQEILVAMVEDSTATYGMPDIAIETVKSIKDVQALVADLAQAGARGRRLPKLFVLDDLSSLSQQERRAFERNPITGADGVTPDTRTMFRLKGYGMVDLMMDIRTDLPIDSITLVRAHEGAFSNPVTGQAAAPELALEGNIAPKNLTGNSGVTMYLKSEAPKITPAQFFDAFEKKQLFMPYRTVALTEEEVAQAYALFKTAPDAPVDTTIINRWFLTQDNGEIMGKGHHALRLKEKAYLPDILRLIHGEKPIYLKGR